MALSLDALANAARLKNSSSMANVAQFFPGMAEGHVPSAHEQVTGDANAETAATELGGGPAIAALRHAADAARLAHLDSELGTEADLGSGRPQHIAGMQHANANTLAALDSEAEAGREYLPFAQQLHDRGIHELDQKLTNQYVLPAQLKAQGDVQAATIDAQGRVQAAQAPQAGLPMRGLLSALTAIIQKTGAPPTDDQLRALQHTYSNIR